MDSDEEGDDEEDGEQALLDPLFVYADIEAMQLPDRTFEPNLLCYHHHEDSAIYSLKGPDCCLQFLRCLDVPDDDRDRPISVTFHNLKGFDGMFIIEQLYQQQRPVENQLTVGAKVLSFQSGPLTFKDSLCFLRMRLSAFSSTFNLTELKKGFFPRSSTPPQTKITAHPFLLSSTTTPRIWVTKRKKNCKPGTLSRFVAGSCLTLKRNLRTIVNPMWLCGGCEAFCQEFEQHAGFNPFAKCVAIASACNLY